MLRELNNEAILLMYFADELSAEDRAEVARMLEADAGMRQALTRLESAVESFEVGMSTIDARPLASEAAALRRIALAMRQHVIETAEVAAAPKTNVPALTLRYPWWMYPAIGAAAVLVLMVSWWGSHPTGPLKIGPKNPALALKPKSDSTKALATIDEPEAVENIDNPNPTILPETVASLDALQDQVAEISRSQPIPFVGDGNE